MPGALQSWGQSGKGQHRATLQIGRMWTELYVPFLAGSPEGRKFVALINQYWRSGTEFTIDHRSYLTHNGGGTGTARVNGASQTGSSLNTDGWTGSNPVLRAGDIIAIAGLKHVLDVTADAPNLVAGACALAIHPPIFAGGSPADNAIITYTGVPLNAKIAAPPEIPPAAENQYIGGLSITFRESI
jgi:hypothetical protein